ncbi:type VI secretion system baseplate subunit TssF [Tundrisphaera sp. TA3]|uniref:type VI secretion system baseplate subunit TssF n=1 Tax=Tundrisphaera sp. TA3 TaxID=3435775 RepID=UPI003EB8B0A8
MADELLGYYNAELAFLREMGAEFAARYPKVAGRLHLEAEKCEDPHVERLLEGFAFLAARLRRKIDDQFPEITDALLGLVAPHYQAPLPSMSVVQFVPDPARRDAAAGFAIPRKSALHTRPVAGQPCQFRTAYPVTLWPIEVESARLEPDRVVAEDRPPGAVALLRIALRGKGGTRFDAMTGLDRLRFYLDGTGATPFGLHEILLNDACRVVVRGRGVDGQPISVTLPPDAIRPVGFGRDEGMFPFPARAFLGYRLLLEYFAFPEKFLFVDLTGLEKLAGRGLGDAVELLIFLDKPPRADLSATAENFRLGCTPVVNLFSRLAEPISVSQAKFEYRVVPDVHRPNATEVYSIDAVTGAAAYLAEPVRYEPFYARRHSVDGREARAFWHASRRPSGRKGDRGTEVYLSFVDLDFTPTAPAGETATVRITCTNRDLPGKLPFGGDQADFTLEGQAPVGRIRCLRKPTDPLRAPAGPGAHWRLISHLSLNHLSLADSARGLDALREVLAAHDFADTDVTRKQIAGLARVASRPAVGRVSRRVGASVCVGVEVTLEFDESEYVGTGAFLLASVLERFLGLYASINSFSQTVAKTTRREGTWKRWPPRAGERTLL